MPTKTKINKQIVKKEIKIEDPMIVPEEFQKVKIVRKAKPKVKKAVKSKVKKINLQNDSPVAPRPFKGPKPWTMSFNRILLITVIAVIVLILVVLSMQKILQLEKSKVQTSIKTNPIVKVEPKDQVYQNPSVGFKLTYDPSWTLDGSQSAGLPEDEAVITLSRDNNAVTVASWKEGGEANFLNNFLITGQIQIVEDRFLDQDILLLGAINKLTNQPEDIYLLWRGDHAYLIAGPSDAIGEIFNGFDFYNAQAIDNQRTISGKVTYNRKSNGYVVDGQFLGNDSWRYGYYLDSNVEIRGVDSQNSAGQPVFLVWSIKENDLTELTRDIFAPVDLTNLELYANNEIGFSFNYAKGWVVKPAAAGSDLINLNVRDGSSKLLAIIKASNKTLEEVLTKVYADYQILSLRTRVINGANWLELAWWNEAKNGMSYFWLLEQNGTIFQVQGDPEIFYNLSFSSK